MSSLAIVLLTAALAGSGVLPLEVALGLVLGANLGSAALVLLSTARATVEVRQLSVGNFLSKLLAVAAVAPFAEDWVRLSIAWLPNAAAVVVVVFQVIKRNDLRLLHKLRQLDDAVDDLYSSIKRYLTRLSRETLNEEESRRWTDIVSFTINMEQVGDTIERVLLDVEEKKIRKGRSFSPAGRAEIADLHARLLDNLRLGMSVFLNGNLHDARRLLEQKARFRELEISYANAHLGRLADNTLASIETSSLHLEIIGEFKRINSHICSIAYPILETAGALNPNRLRLPLPATIE